MGGGAQQAHMGLDTLLNSLLLLSLFFSYRRKYLTLGYIIQANFITDSGILFGIAQTRSNPWRSGGCPCLFMFATSCYIHCVITTSSSALPLLLEYISRVSHSFFSSVFRHYQMDKFCARKIGAFWLTKLSWKLFGHAVHIATAMGINQSVRNAWIESQEHFERVRIFTYCIFVTAIFRSCMGAHRSFMIIGPCASRSCI